MLGAGIDDQVDVDLEVARADRRLDARARPARVGQRARDRRLARAEEAEHAPLGGRARASTACTGSASSAADQSRWSSPGGPGSTTTTVPSCSSTSAGAVPAMPTANAPSGSDACLRTPASKSVRPPQPLRDRARDGLDLRVQLVVDVQLASRHPREQLDRPVVRGPEPARRDEQVGPQPVAQRVFELRLRVADDLDPRRLEPARQQLAGEERTVAVGALTADELAAGDDDDRARARQRWAAGRASSPGTPSAVAP